MLLVYKVRTYVLLLLVVVPSFFVTINQKNKRVKETSFKRPAKYYFVVSPSTYVYPTIYVAAVPYRYLIVCIHFFCQNALNGEGFFLSHLTTTTTSRTLEYVYHQNQLCMDTQNLQKMQQQRQKNILWQNKILHLISFLVSINISTFQKCLR